MSWKGLILPQEKFGWSVNAPGVSQPLFRTLSNLCHRRPSVVSTAFLWLNGFLLAKRTAPGKLVHEMRSTFRGRTQTGA